MKLISIRGFACSEARELSDAYIDDELLEEAQSQVSRHIRYCNDCAALIEEKIGLKRLVHASVRDLAVPANLSQSVRARIRM